MDVLVAGGGPAGSVLAWALARQGLRTLVLERARSHAWRDAVLGGGCFVLGAAPFVAMYLAGRESVTDPALFPLLRAAVQYRFDYLLLPQRLDALLSVAFHSLLPAAALAWLAWRRQWPRDLGTLALLGAVALARREN